MAEVIDIEQLHKTFEEVNQDDSPIAVSTPSGNQVIGNPTKANTTEPKDYELVFWLPIPDGGQAPAGAKLVMDGTAYEQKVVAKQKFITQRIGRKVRSYGSTVALAFINLKSDGTSELYTPEEFLEMYSMFTDEVLEALEKLVMEVLGVSEHLINYITDASLIENSAKILKNNPSFFQVDELYS